MGMRFQLEWMQGPKQIVFLNRFRPQRSGSLELSSGIVKKSSSSFEISLPSSSSVFSDLLIFCRPIVLERRVPFIHLLPLLNQMLTKFVSEYLLTLGIFF